MVIRGQTPPGEEPIEMRLTEVIPGRLFTDEMDGGDFVVRTVHLLEPAAGERLVAVGEVIKRGRTLAITRAEVHSEQHGSTRLCAIMQQTLMVMAGKPDR